MSEKSHVTLYHNYTIDAVQRKEQVASSSGPNEAVSMMLLTYDNPQCQSDLAVLCCSQRRLTLRKKQLLSNLVHQRVLHPTSLSDVILASLATCVVSVDSELHTYMRANCGLVL